MKFVGLVIVGAALIGVRVWGANRRRAQFERATRFRGLPLQRRPATVKLLLAAAVLVLGVVALMSFNGATS
jgi:hypothetical protein